MRSRATFWASLAFTSKAGAGPTARSSPPRSVDRLSHRSIARRWRERLERDDPCRSVLVLARGTEIGGFASFGTSQDDPHWLGCAGETYMIYLDPALVGHGHGARLWAGIVERLEDQGMLWLTVWVLARNTRARRFYERMGLRLDTARRWDVHGSRSVPVVRYARALNPVFDFETLRGTAPIG